MCSDFYLMLAEESLLNKRRQESETDFDFVFKKKQVFLRARVHSFTYLR